MSGADKARNKFQKLSGLAKEAVGRTTRNRRLETEGRNDQRRADLKDAGEKVKDVFRPKGPRQQTRRQPRRQTPR
jgi:uncharacterized protein YjbJ (UPF0337 family)